MDRITRTTMRRIKERMEQVPYEDNLVDLEVGRLEALIDHERMQARGHTTGQRGTDVRERLAKHRERLEALELDRGRAIHRAIAELSEELGITRMYLWSFAVWGF